MSVAVDDPQLAPYRDLNQANLSRGSGRFICEGGLLVERLLRSGLPVESVVVDESQSERYRALIANGIPVFVVPRGTVSSLVGFKFHRGVLACGRRPAVRSLPELLSPVDQPRALVVCIHVQDPENLGGIIRSSAAFGVDGVVLTGGCADPFSRRVLRTSMGTVLTLPIFESPQPTDVLDQLGAGKMVRIATVLAPDAESLPDAARPTRMALVFGSEGTGLDAESIAACDRRVTLPMRRGTDSLNVSVAAGVFLFHFLQPTPPDRNPTRKRGM